MGIDPPRWQASLDLAAQYPGYIYLALGLHPNDILRANDPDAAMALLEKLILAHPGRVIGVGETGLDYYHQDVPAKTQEKYFLEHIGLARRFALPLVVHCRDAMPHLIEILAAHGRDLPIMMHCFSGTPEEAAICLELGAQVYISIAGPVTFPKALDRQEVVRRVPLDRLLTETDCPFLTPQPFRGKRNEPARVALVAQKIATLKEISYEAVIAQTGQNVQNLFGLS